jgi:beta-lactamase superfamily II metal-dependent hydrolase
MGYEIDFLAVGEESKGGDAIALRYGNLHGSRAEQTVVVVDGGYSDSGKALVEFVRNKYGTDEVDIVLATHPDRDHISGLETVLLELAVGHLLMHLPWNHFMPLQEARKSNFQPLASFSEKLAKSMQEASELESIAQSRGVPITEPFTGVVTTDGRLRVLGPSLPYYEELLPQIASPESMAQRLAKLSVRVREAVAGALADETLDHETLRDDGVTTASNNSSVITLLDVDGRRSLLTADVGIPALEQGVAVLEAEGFQPGSLRFVQVPHHGSRRSVGPSVLDRLLGQKGQQETHSTAFVSAPRKNPEAKHPAKKVTNAFRRRGYGVHGTQGANKWHHYDAPVRPDYTRSDPIPFHSVVEEDSDG